MASSSSAVATSFSNKGYDVFINHRGPDVKKTFASHLYRRLLSHGLRPFLDIEEQNEGDDIATQIEAAIATASVHVAIFSPRYAESRWCLEELVLMLHSGAVILPVFYHVKPSELRWTKGKYGVYAQALQELQMKTTYDSETRELKPRYNSSTIENWRSALFRVSDLYAFELDVFNGDEADLLDEVVQSVLKRVRKPSLDVAKYPTGLNEKVEDFETSLDENVGVFENTVLQRQSGKLQVLGIVGFAGVGKTTLAKKLFDKMKSSFSRSFFLSDIREKAPKNGLHFLQRELCKGLINLDIQVDSVTEGIELFKENVSSIYGSSALVILDDVDQVNQLGALLPDQNDSPSKSLILITSRNKDVLTRSRIEESSIYNLTGLNLERSKELFCSKAFKAFDDCLHALWDFEPVVEKFIKACPGLPFHLEVYGALFCGKIDVSDWEDQLENLLYLDLNQSLPNWDREQLDRLPRDIEKFKDLSREARGLMKKVLSQRQSGKVQVVGIVGSDGVGKTFLARELFEIKKLSYSKSCILYDVRSSSLQSLLKKLLKGLSQLDIQVDSVDEGTDLFKEHISSFPSLVILDNVDHWDPLHEFLSVLTTVLPSTSLILITSLDKDVLKHSGVEESSVYELNGLNMTDSLELFCTHAFGQNSPLSEFEDLVEKFLIACNGLPLTLKVFGALLCEKVDIYSQDQWDTLEKKMRSIDTKNKLKICYEALTKEEQQMFLHIACSCIGEKRALALKLWDRTGSGGGLLGFERLKKRCLVEVDSEDCIIMHEQLRDLGRTIAEETGLRRRL
jgi:Cdc6-like AAA superfamily ATPase